MIKIEEIQNVFVHLLQSDFLQHDLRELMNGVQSLFLTVDNHGLIQASVAIARITLTKHWKMAILQKKMYLWNLPPYLNSLNERRVKNYDHRKNDSEVAVDPFAHYPLLIKKTPEG